MKQFILFLSAALFAWGTASAQRFQVGLRGGVNTVDHHFGTFRVGDAAVRPGKVQLGYDAGLVVRLNISRHLHLQTELNYSFVNYDFDVDEIYTRRVKVRTERFEIPVQLGFQFGALRLFGGAQFRVAQTGRSSNGHLLDVRFNDDDIALMGGVGLNIRKFFIDFRVSGYPRSHVWNTFRSGDVSERVKIGRSIVYGGSIGFFF